jgi:hypothetical protein
VIRDTFLATCRVMHEFVGHEQVRSRWHEPSALSEMTVGAVAGHTARAALRVEDFLAEDGPTGGSPVSAPQYYVRLGGYSAQSDEFNAGIRARAAAEAADGVDALLWRIGECLARLHERLPQEPADRMITTGGLPMLLDDYLRTRIVELTVHVDDLAASIDVATPAMPSEALDDTIATLVAVALGRHGDLAVLRALTRAERDEVRALRVL